MEHHAQDQSIQIIAEELQHATAEATWRTPSVEAGREAIIGAHGAQAGRSLRHTSALLHEVSVRMHVDWMYYRSMVLQDQGDTATLHAMQQVYCTAYLAAYKARMPTYVATLTLDQVLAYIAEEFRERSD